MPTDKQIKAAARAYARTHPAGLAANQQAMKAALKAAARAAWEPVSGKHKTGAEMLTYRRGHPEGFVSVAMWVFDDGRWFVADGEGGGIPISGIRGTNQENWVTHVMPLPAPPTSEDSET